MKRALVSLLLVQIAALLLSLWGSAGVALGLNPESLQTLDVVVPLVALGSVAFGMGRGRSWKDGLVVALPSIGFWLVMHAFSSTRFRFEFWRDGWTQLSLAHLGWWLLALLVALAGAMCGAKFQSKALRVGFTALALLFVSLAQLLTPRDLDAHFEPDCTSWRVREFSLSEVQFGIYDADFDDARPLDNRNATWLAQAMPRVWDKITRINGSEPLCVVNGGFFGASSPLIGEHEAPLRTGAGSFYDVSSLEKDWPDQNATLVWKRENGQTKPQILLHARFDQLKAFDGALGGVRVLMASGKRQELKPGMGGTTLKCSRTSVAWNTRTQQFWVLGVRDPDGEASSVRDNKIEKQTGRRVQVSGWDVAQVQRFWIEKGATDALLFDGGESGQIAYRGEQGRWRWIHSSYHLSRTPFWANEKPLRAVLPMLPPTLANGGVLNWFYVRKKF